MAVRPFDLIIFDCDGVLIDSEVIACRADAECFTEYGFPTSTENVMTRYVGTSAAFMFADIEARHGRALPADFSAILHAHLEQAFETDLHAMPHVAEVLAQLPCASCVASSSSPERLRHSLALVSLLDRFGANAFSATEVERGKPAPDLFLFAAQSMDAAPERCLVIEDSVAGVQAGVAAGMTVYGFVGGSHCAPGHADQLRTAGASEVLADMRELLSSVQAQ